MGISVKAAFGIGKAAVGVGKSVVKAALENKKTIVKIGSTVASGLTIASRFGSYRHSMEAGSLEHILGPSAGARSMRAVDKAVNMMPAQERAAIAHPGALSIRHVIRDKNFANELEAKEFIVKRLKDR